MCYEKKEDVLLCIIPPVFFVKGSWSLNLCFNYVYLHGLLYIILRVIVYFEINLNMEKINLNMENLTHVLI